MKAYPSRIALGVILLLFVMLVKLGGKHETIDGSVVHFHPEGRAALFQVLRELGTRTRAWRKPPGDLAEMDTALWLSRPPTFALTGDDDPEDPDEPDDPDEPEATAARNSDAVDPLSGSRHARSSYRHFVVRGGRLVVPAGDEMLEFLAEELALTDAGTIELVELTSNEEDGEVELLSERGESLSAVLEFGLSVPRGSPARRLFITSDGAEGCFGLEFQIGRGAVIVLAEDDLFDNGRIADADHALLVVRLIEELGDEIYFDEYALGRWVPRSKLQLAFSQTAAPATLLVILLLVIFMWRSAWPRAFPRDPRGLVRRSPLARVRALASLFLRAGRLEELARDLRRGVVQRLQPGTRRLDPDLTLHADEDRWRERVEAEIEVLAEGAGSADAVDSWRQALLGPVPRSRVELEQLGDALLVLERAAFAARDTTRRKQ